MKVTVVSLIVLLATLAFAQSGAAPVSSSATSSAAKVVVGIMPAYDASAETYGEIFTQNLTHMLYEELQSTGFEPVLLNPGGAYTPLDSDLINEFAQMSKVDAVLITIMQMPTKPKTGHYTLKVDAQLLDPKAGTLTAMRSYTENIRREEAIVEGGYIGFAAMWGFGTGGSRRFEKQPLGKRARSFARAIRQQAASEVPTIAPAGTAPARGASTGSCPVSFRVTYPRKNAVSKSYGLIINGKEESLWVKEGVANVSLPAGPALIFVTLADAPYRLPVQRLYASNAHIDCSKAERALVLEVGPAGEAFLRGQ